jgi:hypothetical protein
MASSSLPHIILHFQSTATLFVDAGKSHWLTARKDLVNAKRSKTNSSVVSSVDELGSDADGRKAKLAMLLMKSFKRSFKD